MGRKILALIENNIGTRLLLTTRLGALGYQVIALTAPDSFMRRIRGEAFDWIVLDETAVRPVRRHLAEELRQHQPGARIVWLGRSPQRWPVPIEATFVKPLRYEELVRFFARQDGLGSETSGHPPRGGQAEGEAGDGPMARGSSGR